MRSTCRCHSLERLRVYERHRAPRTARVVEESNEMGELYHIDDAERMRQAFHDRNIAKSRNEWLYPYDPLHAPLTSTKEETS